MEFYWKWAFLLFLILPFVGYFNLKKTGKTAALKFSHTDKLNFGIVPIRVKFWSLPIWLRLVCIALLIVALARPRQGITQSRINTEAIAINLVVDCSGSMREPIELNGREVSKLDAVKYVVDEFLLGNGKDLKGRVGDFVGLITYATYPETVCPLVSNHKILTDFLAKKQPITDKQLGNTAIGDALALSAARLYRAEAELQRRKFDKEVSDLSKSEDQDFKIKSKVIILLTDGMQNAGEYSLEQAAELAKKWGIKIYAIGIAPDRVVDTFFGRQRISGASQLNEGMLQNISTETGGFYARADSTETLLKIYEKIDALEKTEIQTFQFTQYNELFGYWLSAGLILLFIEILLKNTIFRKIP